MNSIQPRELSEKDRKRTASEESHSSTKSRMSTLLLKTKNILSKSKVVWIQFCGYDRKASVEKADAILNPRMVEYASHEVEFVRTITSLATSEAAYDSTLREMIKALNALTEDGSAKELASLRQTLTRLHRVSEDMIDYLVAWAREVSQKVKAREDPSAKFNAFLSATRDYLNAFSKNMEAVNALKAADPVDLSLSSLVGMMNAPLVRAMDYRYAFRCFVRQMGIERAVAKRLHDAGTKETFASLKNFCGDILAVSGVEDSFRAIVDLEDSLCLDAVMSLDGTKIKGVLMTHLAKPMPTRSSTFNTAPTITLPAHTFLKIEKIVYDKATKETKVTGTELRFYVLSDCLVITQADKKSKKEMLQYAPVSIDQLEISRVPEQECRFDIKINGLGLLALSNGDKALVTAFIDLVEMHKSKVASSCVPSSVANSVQGTPKKAVVPLMKVKPESVSSILSLLPREKVGPTIDSVVVPVEVKMKPNEIKLRESPSDSIIYGYNQEHNHDVRDAVIKALADPESTKTIEQVVTEIRTLETAKCMVYRWNPETKENDKIGKLMMSLTREASGAAYISFNDLVTGRSSMVGRVGVQVQAILREDKCIVLIYLDKRITTRYISQDVADRIFASVSGEQKNAVAMLHRELVGKGLISSVFSMADVSTETVNVIEKVVAEIGEHSISSLQVQCIGAVDTVSVDGKYSVGGIAVSSITHPESVFFSAPFDKNMVLTVEVDSSTIKYDSKSIKLFTSIAQSSLLQEAIAKATAIGESIAVKAMQHKAKQFEMDLTQASPVKRIDHNLFFTSRARKNTTQIAGLDQLLPKASSSTLTEDQDTEIPTSKFVPMPRSVANQRRPSHHPPSKYDNEKTLSVHEVLDRLQSRVSNGFVDKETTNVFKMFESSSMDHIFESKVLSIRCIKALTEVIKMLLVDDVKQREQLTRLKPNGIVVEKLSQLATQGVIN